MRKTLSTLIAIAFMSSPALAQDTKKTMPKDHPPVSKEQREKMAAHHEKMAACLRSEKTFEECHNEMQVSCEKDMEACPMMGMGKKGMKMHKKMMKMHEHHQQTEEKK